MDYDYEFEVCSKCGTSCADPEECAWIIEQKPRWNQEAADRRERIENAAAERCRVLMFPSLEDPPKPSPQGAWPLRSSERGEHENH